LQSANAEGDGWEENLRGLNEIPTEQKAVETPYSEKGQQLYTNANAPAPYSEGLNYDKVSGRVNDIQPLQKSDWAPQQPIVETNSAHGTSHQPHTIASPSFALNATYPDTQIQKMTDDLSLIPEASAGPEPIHETLHYDQGQVNSKTNQQSGYEDDATLQTHRAQQPSIGAKSDPQASLEATAVRPAHEASEAASHSGLVSALEAPDSPYTEVLYNDVSHSQDLPYMNLKSPMKTGYREEERVSTHQNNSEPESNSVAAESNYQEQHHIEPPSIEQGSLEQSPPHGEDGWGAEDTWGSHEEEWAPNTDAAHQQQPSPEPPRSVTSEQLQSPPIHQMANVSIVPAIEVSLQIEPEEQNVVQLQPERKESAQLRSPPPILSPVGTIVVHQPPPNLKSEQTESIPAIAQPAAGSNSNHPEPRPLAPASSILRPNTVPGPIPPIIQTSTPQNAMQDARGHPPSAELGKLNTMIEEKDKRIALLLQEGKSSGDTPIYMLKITGEFLARECRSLTKNIQEAEKGRSDLQMNIQHLSQEALAAKKKYDSLEGRYKDAQGTKFPFIEGTRID